MQLTKVQLKKLTQLVKAYCREKKISYLEQLEKQVLTYENAHVSDTGQILIRWRNGIHQELTEAIYEKKARKNRAS